MDLLEYAVKRNTYSIRIQKHEYKREKDTLIKIEYIKTKNYGSSISRN